MAALATRPTGNRARCRADGPVRPDCYGGSCDAVVGREIDRRGENLIGDEILELLLAAWPSEGAAGEPAALALRRGMNHPYQAKAPAVAVGRTLNNQDRPWLKAL